MTANEIRLAITAASVCTNLAAVFVFLLVICLVANFLSDLRGEPTTDAPPPKKEPKC